MRSTPKRKCRLVASRPIRPLLRLVARASAGGSASGSCFSSSLSLSQLSSVVFAVIITVAPARTRAFPVSLCVVFVFKRVAFHLPCTSNRSAIFGYVDTLDGTSVRWYLGHDIATCIWLFFRGCSVPRERKFAPIGECMCLDSRFPTDALHDYLHATSTPLVST